MTQANGLPLEATSSDVTEVISVETARTMMQLLQAVVRQGTAVAASQMKHPFGGKTGTTNDFTDAWFIGFSPSVTCGTWIGYDDRQSLGEKRPGARAALPMWMDFMRAAIANKPNEAFPTAGAPKKTLDVPMSSVGGCGQTSEAVSVEAGRKRIRMLLLGRRRRLLLLPWFLRHQWINRRCLRLRVRRRELQQRLRSRQRSSGTGFRTHHPTQSEVAFRFCDVAADLLLESFGVWPAHLCSESMQEVSVRGVDSFRSMGWKLSR